MKSYGKTKVYIPKAGDHFSKASKDADQLANLLDQQIVWRFNDVLLVARPDKYNYMVKGML